MSSRSDSADYAQLFLSGAPLLDTRAPVEFAKGSFPTAINLPLMTDDERAAVGTCYKQKGQDAAIALGHELVSGSVKEERVETWAEFARQNPNGYLYCFRGGMRSQISQQWLKEAGVDYPRITGGYKAMRRFLIDSLDRQCATAQFWLVAGATGCGKTRLVTALPRSVDLEGLAKHRGSAFGRLLEPQPSQIDFENAISIEFLKLGQRAGPIILEDEGRLIGRLSLPENLRERMAQAPLLVLRYPLEERVQVVLEDYIIDLGRRFSECHGEEGMEQHRTRLLGDLERTRKRLGGERYAEVSQMMASAFDEQVRRGSIEAHRAWIETLLRDYYDPMYEYQLSQREGRSLAEGTREELAAYVAEMLGDADQ